LEINIEHYPELKKKSKIQSDSQKIGFFLEWLSKIQSIELCKHDNQHETIYYDGDDSMVESGAYLPVSFQPNNIEYLLALYFEIDLDKVNQERDQMLKNLSDSKRSQRFLNK
jgi:hypothetical protein